MSATRRHRGHARWRYDYTVLERMRAKFTQAELWSGKVGECAMVSPTGKPCTLPFSHRGRHRTTPIEASR